MRSTGSSEREGASYIFDADDRTCNRTETGPRRSCLPASSSSGKKRERGLLGAGENGRRQELVVRLPSWVYGVHRMS